MANKKHPDNLSEIESRLYYLHGLKQPAYKLVKDARKKYVWKKLQQPDPYKSNYETNVTFSVIQTKLAEVASGLQEYDFIPMDTAAEANKIIFKYIWQYVWLTTNTDKYVLDAFESALKFWDWYIYEGTKKIVRTVNVPNWLDEDWKTIWKEEDRVDWDWIYTEYIPWENIFHDWESIEDANEVVWIKDWDRVDFIKQHENNQNYKNVNEQLPIWRHYYIASDSKNAEMSFKPDTNTENIVTELRYYNKSKDKFYVYVNRVCVHEGYIPYKHKELPFVHAVDIPVEGRSYNMWEYELLETDERFKDALRALSIDVIKQQFWFTTISPDADFDEGTLTTWPNRFLRVDKDDISFYAPNIGTASLAEAERKADEDIIIKSGIDFRSQLLWPTETATKTQAKQQSARKRINLMLKQNAFSFFERLARLRVANIQVEFSDKARKIFLKWGTADPKGNYSPTNSWYWTFTVRPEHVKGIFNIVPVTDSILWISSEREKVRALEFMQAAGNLAKSDWAPVMNNEKAFNWIAKKFDINPEEISWDSPLNKTPDDIMREIENDSKWIPNDNKDPNSPEFIPWAQQSGAKTNVPIQWSFAANTID